MDLTKEVNSLIKREKKWLNKMTSNNEMYHERHIDDIKYDINTSQRKITTLKKVLKILIEERI